MRLTRVGGFVAVLLIWSGGLTVATESAGAVTIGPEPVAGTPGLPDGRVYEKVSPGEKNGYDVLGGEETPLEASEDGSTVDYNALGAFGGASANALANTYAGSRASFPWTTLPLNSATPEPPTQFGSFGVEYALPQHLTEPIYKSTEPLAGGSPSNVPNLYLRRADGTYTLITANAPPPSQAGKDVLQFLGASRDLSHIIFSSTADLTGNAPLEPTENEQPIVYEYANGELQLVGVLPDKTASEHSTNATLSGNSISTDGRYVFFSVNEGEPAEKQLYVRENGTKTVEVSASQRSAPDPNGPRRAFFEGATPDGGTALFRSTAELTNNASTGEEDTSNDLYAYHTATGALTDLSADANPTDAASGAGLLGVVGISDDGTYVYFVASGQLVPGQGVDGEPNLYLWHEGQPLRFIATLNESDSLDWFFSNGLVGRGGQTSYVTPDGRHLAFDSINSLTGYKNTDAKTALADKEVFVYSADTDTLSCASCSPGGIPPAANATVPPTEQSEYPPRVLSDAGSRLFFESSGPLAPGSANGHVKVFEYEAGGIYMISSGSSQTDDHFGDASKSGSDVFFSTRAQIVPADRDGLVDLYDAREGGQAEPVSVAPTCREEGCEEAPGSLPAFGPPASTTFSGEGNASLVHTAPSTKATQSTLARHRHQKRKKRGRAGRHSTTAGRKAHRRKRHV